MESNTRNTLVDIKTNSTVSVLFSHNFIFTCVYSSLNRYIKGCLVDEALTEMMTAGTGIVPMQPSGINTDNGTTDNKKPDGECKGNKVKSDNDPETKPSNADDTVKEKSGDDESSVAKEKSGDTEEKSDDKDKEE